MHPIIRRLKNKVIEGNRLGLPIETIRVSLKEILQDYVLASIYKSNKYFDLNFIGGTALRKLHSLERYSEDLDFVTDKQIDLEDLGNEILKYFKSIDYHNLDFSIQQSESVNRLLIKFEVLHDLGLSAYQNEKLYVKVEITTNKIYESKPFPLTLSNISMVLKAYDLETMMSGKILACLERTFKKGESGVYLKGRDYYDLLWYMNKGIIPNQEVLTDRSKEYDIEKVFEILDEKVSGISSRDLILDLETFFTDNQYIKSWCENFHDMYKNLRENYKF